MMALIAAVIQLLTLVFKSWLERDAELKKEQEAKREGWKQAVKSGDLSSINSSIARLRS